MKKLLPMIIIGIILIGMPMTMAIPIPFTQLSKPLQKTLIYDITTFENKETTSIKDTPPPRANGNFSGVWGLDIWGEHHIPLGWMLGYFKLTVNVGYFAAGFNFFGEPDILWFIQGYIFGIFMFGNMGENEYTNQTFFAGICKTNETDYHWRIIGEEGPVFFMQGKYSIFD